MRSDLQELAWGTGGGVVAGSMAVSSDSAVPRAIFGAACMLLLNGALVHGWRSLRRQPRRAL